MGLGLVFFAGRDFSFGYRVLRCVNLLLSRRRDTDLISNDDNVALAALISQFILGSGTRSNLATEPICLLSCVTKARKILL